MTDKQTFDQSTPYESPWTLKQRIAMLLWEYVWLLTCRWTPKPFSPWRVFVLKQFGTRVYGRPFVHQRARINIPWHLTLHDYACLGDRSNAYCLGEIEILSGATIAQEAYLCTGTHDFSDPALPLQTSRIVIGKNAFVGARAFILPGVRIGDCAVVGACSVVTRDVDSDSVVAGNPARPIYKASVAKHSPLESENNEC